MGRYLLAGLEEDCPHYYHLTNLQPFFLAWPVRKLPSLSPGHVNAKNRQQSQIFTNTRAKVVVVVFTKFFFLFQEEVFNLFQEALDTCEDFFQALTCSQQQVFTSLTKMDGMQSHWKFWLICIIKKA